MKVVKSSLPWHAILILAVPFLVQLPSSASQVADAPQVRSVTDDSNPAITYTDFTSYSDGGLLNGTGNASQKSDATAQFNFNGSSITWIGARNLDLGTADVFIDGTLASSVDQHAARVTYQVPLFQKSWPNAGPHTIKIVSTSNLKTVIDAFVTETDPMTLPPDAPTWSLATVTTQVVLRVWQDVPYIEVIRDAQKKWNWLPGPIPMALPTTASGHPLPWHFQEEKTDKSAGTRITLRFTCAAPNLELISTWWAHPGPGPVEYKSVITNNSNDPVSFDNQQVISADLQLISDADVTLHRFYKLADVRNQDRTGCMTSNILASNTSIVSFARNGINDHPADIPFQVFDVGSVHGLYFGYEWSFGQFQIAALSNPHSLTYRALLGLNGQITIQAGRTLTVPPMYVGTYNGDLDDGGNQFKRWFWKYKMTATLRDNPNEPLLEYCVPGNEAGLKKFFNDYPVASWGGELAKIDVDWLPKGDGPDKDWFGVGVKSWTADPLKWPLGMKAREMTMRHGQKLSLYMPHSFEDCDLATDAGREKEKQALLQRYDAGMYDYYRSDFVVEGSQDYLKHEGFMYVLDSLISQRPNFRYEHCSAGGTLKDFSTLQRLTFMTTEDSATPDGHRLAMYSSTYMINPVQLKADIAISGGPGADTNPTWVRYCLRTGFMGANMATSWGSFTPAMITETKLAWPLYTSKMRPILRGADVYHILPPCTGVDWDGLQYDNPALGQGAVLLFKAAAKFSDAHAIKLQGLDPAASYALTFQDRTDQDVTASGASLMDNGLNITGLTGDYASEIIWLKKE